MTGQELDLPATAPLQVVRCQACHRELTDPASRARRTGPECAARLHPASSVRSGGDWPSSPDDPTLPIPPTQPPLPYQESTDDDH